MGTGFSPSRAGLKPDSTYTRQSNVRGWTQRSPRLRARPRLGGKECQATHPAAIVAHKTKRPARKAYGKDDDMIVTGGRHPFQNDYKVAFTRDGVMTALKADLFSDGGAYADLSPAVMGRAMTHIDNAYFIANAAITGTVCRTNFPPNTAFRGFGGPQGAATIENILEEIAAMLGKDPLEIRMKNCYGTDDRNITPYGQLVQNNHLPQFFRDLPLRADYYKTARGSGGVQRAIEDRRTRSRTSRTCRKYSTSTGSRITRTS